MAEGLINFQQEDTVECPYFKAHKVPKSRLHLHINTCPFKTDSKATCPFNASHIVERHELDHHIRTCTNRLSYEHFCNGEIKQEGVPEVPHVENGENWDDLPESPTYNPTTHVENYKVLRCPTGLSKSGRRRFRENERKRFMELNGVSTGGNQ